jgi:hypothetical protein
MPLLPFFQKGWRETLSPDGVFGVAYRFFHAFVVLKTKNKEGAAAKYNFEIISHLGWAIILT